MPEQKLFGPITLSGRALYDDGQMINSNVINHVTKERLVRAFTFTGSLKNADRAFYNTGKSRFYSSSSSSSVRAVEFCWQQLCVA